MATSKEQAVEIARELLRSRASSGSVRLDTPLSVQRETRRGNSDLWVVLFECIDPPGVVTCPGEVIVEVDEETGRPEIFRTP